MTLDELRARLGAVALLDVRSPREFDGSAGAACDPRQGHIPGARNVPLTRFLECETAEDVVALVGLPEGAEVVAYCHSGSRSGVAAQILRAAGYDGRNYVGSWHAWSRDLSLPVES